MSNVIDLLVYSSLFVVSSVQIVFFLWPVDSVAITLIRTVLAPSVCVKKNFRVLALAGEGVRVR
jgi:hypothetical protein